MNDCLFCKIIAGDIPARKIYEDDEFLSFLDIFPKLVRRRMNQPFSAEEKQAQLRWRGLYAEFNLVYDRGTTFGLKTGGNVDAILMSLPPEVVWA